MSEFSGNSANNVERELASLRARLAELEQKEANCRQENARLHEREGRYRSFIDNSLLGYAYCKMIFEDNQPQDFIYLEVNRTFEEITGLKNVIGKKVTDVIPDIKDTNPELIKIYCRASLTGKPENFEMYLEPLNIFFRVSVFSPEKETFIALFKNISGQKQAEARLQESEKRYRLLFEHMQEGFALHEIILDEQGQTVDFRFLDTNQAYEQHTGLKREDVIGKRMLEVLPTADRAQIQRYGHVALNGEPLMFEYYSNTFNRYMRVRAFSPQPMQFATIFEDISQAREKEAAVRDSEAHLRSLFEQLHDAVFILDLQGQHLAANLRASEMLGYKPEEISSLSVADTSAELDQSQNVITSLLKGEIVPSYERLFRKKDGQVFPVEINVELIRGEDGSPRHIQSVVRDISQRKQAEAALRAAHAELEQRVKERTSELQSANIELETLVHSLAHDLRTPIRALAGYSHLLEEFNETPVNVDSQAYIQRMKAVAIHMGRQIDDLITYMNLSHQAIQKQFLDPAEIARKVWNEFTPARLTSRQMTLSISELPPCRADPNMLWTLFTHLLNNAIKFTRDQPLALIEIGIKGDAYYVRDNGIGFDEQFTEKIFTIFERLHRVDEFEGTGIGLAVVKRIVERHGGHVWAEAQVGRGATFFFTMMDNNE